MTLRIGKTVRTILAGAVLTAALSGYAGAQQEDGDERFDGGGTINRVALGESSTLVIGDVSYRVSADTEVRDARGGRIAASDLEPGQRVAVRRAGGSSAPRYAAVIQVLPPGAELPGRDRDEQ